MNELADKQRQGTVFVVDDEAIARKSLERFLKSHGFRTKTFSSGADFLEHLPLSGVGCLVLDLQMPGMTGLELQEKLAEAGCDVPTVFLTGHGDIPTTVRAMKQGADNFLPKMADEDELLDAIHQALQRSADTFLQQQRKQEAHALANSLTEREREVCSYVIRGLPNKQIAREMGIAERTVKAHRAKVMQKFNADSLAQLVRIAQEAGITHKE